MARSEPIRAGGTTSAALAWGLLALAMAVLAAGVVLLLVSVETPTPAGDWGFRGFTALFAVSFPVVGLLIARRHSSNAVGWLLLIAGLMASVQFMTQQYAIVGLVAAPGSLPAAAVAAWLQAWIWVPAVSIMGVYLFLVFPTGRFLSPRWRTIGWLAGIGGAFLTGVLALKPGPVDNFRIIDNPFALSVSSGLIGLLVPLGTVALMLSITAAALSLGLRLRGSRGVERQQLKWVALSGAFVAGTGAFSGFLAPLYAVAGEAGEVMLILAMTSIPVAIGIGILRHRLYDIDRLINRTLVYGALTLSLGAMYVGSIILLQAALSGLIGGNSLAVAASTLAVAALFQPLRRRIQRAVDRRFYRSRYDAGRTLDAFSARLRHEVDLARLTDELRGVATDTLRPASVSVWLRRR